jgi:AAA+ ATPase superfamily predicted ATPase
MFFGREYELHRLKELLGKPTSSLVTCRGRRRIGKSTLFEHFAALNGCRFIKLEGLAPRSGDEETRGHSREITDEDQRAAFGRQLADQTRLPEVTPSSWTQAFAFLDSVITDDAWTVVLLDEISWMGEKSPDFPGDLKVAWDNRFKRHDRLIMVLCGSVSAWITKNILDNAGFVGRPSVDFILPELPLRDCVRFWGDDLSRFATRDIIDILSVTGGVPRYLEEMNPLQTVEENLRRTCFSPDGYLFRDFERIFNRVFGDRAERKRAILVTLADAPKTLADIAKAIGKKRNGHLSDDLEELVLSGFLAGDRGRNPETGELALSTRYRLKDNYTRFYLKYILPVKDRIERGLFEFVSLEGLAGWDAVMGLQFENLVVNNFKSLLPLFALEKTEILSAEPYRRTAGKGHQGCQIDLLIQTERYAFIVEVKRQKSIGQKAIEEITAQVSALPRKKTVSVRTALVYDGELEPCIKAKRAYDFLVSSEELLGL